MAQQAPLSMGFSRQEYGSGLPCSPLEDLPDPGIEPMSPGLAGGFFTTESLASLSQLIQPMSAVSNKDSYSNVLLKHILFLTEILL